MEETAPPTVPTIKDVVADFLGNDFATLCVLSGVAILVALTSAKNSVEYRQSPKARDRLELFMVVAKIAAAILTLLGTSLALLDGWMAWAFPIATLAVIAITYIALYCGYRDDKNGNTLKEVEEK